ncbi:hypothetical protein NQ314_013725 [Rhamnusium bicolor]|uniref:Uncharacterized protein n=1 Tax=Rhamnusium bicolor TaxID=1586634 RepID=A0AAV8X5R0_9CUCU|nr:hypothetical protein NQ314_013725 [Rhamnusium bicolor]
MFISNYSLENSDSLRNQSTKLKDKLEILLDEILQTDEDAVRVIDEIENITGELNKEAGNQSIFHTYFIY